MIFLQSFIKDFSFKVITNEEIKIEQNSKVTEEANNFKIYSIYVGDELLDLDKVNIKGWHKSNTKTGYPIETKSYTPGNKISFRPPVKLLFDDLTINFATSPKYSQAVATYLNDYTMTMYANSSENQSYVDINYTDFGSVIMQALIFILAIILFQEFIYNLISKMLISNNRGKLMVEAIKSYAVNAIVLLLSVLGLLKLKDHIGDVGTFTVFATPYTFNDILALSMIVFLSSLGIKSIYKEKKAQKDEKQLFIANWILFIINPFVAFFVLESAYNPQFQSMAFIYVLINALILFLVQVLIYIVFRKKRVAMISVLLISLAFGIANDALYILRDSPLIPAFLGSLGVAADVANGTTIELTANSLVAFSFAALWFLVISSIKEGKIKISKLSYVKQLGAYSAVFAVILVASVNYFVRQNGVGVNLWRPSRTYFVEGSPYSFYRIFANQILTAPKGYDEENVEETLEEYYNKDVGLKEGQKPNIIMVQSEALADYYGKGDLKLNKDPLEFQKSLKENTIQGNTYVSVLGGGTVNSEYEALSSIPLTFFPLGAYPFQQYVKDGHTSIAKVLEDQGYETFITHPSKPTNYSRQEAWPNLGFSNIAFEPDYDTSEDNYIGNHFMKDSLAYDKLIEQYENKGDKPLFSYLVSMQNHGSYQSNVEGGEIKVLNDTGADDQGANQYLNFLKLSDYDLKNLVEYFKSYDEPTIICIFGDHQPQNYDVFMDLIKSGGEYDNTDVFHTPLTIWANYDIKEEEDVNISLNYLTPYLLKKAGGIKLSAYHKLSLDMMEDYPILTTKQIYNSEGEEVSGDSKFEERNNLLNQVIYYEMKQDTKSDRYFNEASK